jgi:GTP cyclohydrolase I
MERVFGELLDAIGEDIASAKAFSKLRAAPRVPSSFSPRVIASASRTVVNGAIFDIRRERDRDGERHRALLHVRAIIFFLSSGRAHVAYIPDGKVIGLSKVARIVRCFRAPPPDPGAAHHPGRRPPSCGRAPSR